MTAIAVDEISLRRLLAPLSVDAFFDAYVDRKPVHIPGERDRFTDAFSWEAFNGIYEMASLWIAKSLELAMDGKGIPPDQYCFPAPELTRHDRVRSHGTVVENTSGWSLVADNNRTSLGDGAGSLAEWAWPRDYVTWDQAQEALPALDGDDLDQAIEELAQIDFVDAL